jgi:Arc/MetJ-type ribon-helix-helix transcriptional regulator
METIRLLEGDEKSPVQEQEFVDELLKSEKFKSEDEVKRFIRKMQQEAAIYESTPGHWNTV